MTSPHKIPMLSTKLVTRILKLRQVEFVFLIYHQILKTNLQGNEEKLEGIIKNEILGIKGLWWVYTSIGWAERVRLSWGEEGTKSTQRNIMSPLLEKKWSLFFELFWITVPILFQNKILRTFPGLILIFLGLKISP